MTTFTLPSSTPPCPVHLPSTSDGPTQDELLSFTAFKNWTSTLQHSLSLQHSNKSHPFHASPYSLRKIEVQSVDRFGGGRLGFVKLKAEVKNDNDEALPGSVFLRGGSVGMLIILQPDDIPPNTETDKHVLLTLQPRLPAGSLSLPELPAGMLDSSNTFSGAAATEIFEETGLKVEQKDLLDMTALAIPDAEDDDDVAVERLQRGMYTSPGGSDEFVPLFLHQRRVARGTLEEWTGKLTGLRGEGERITLRLVRLEELWRVGARDAKVLGAWALYEGLRREGKIPDM